MKTINLGFVGDLLVNREDALAPFRDVQALLKAPDILFGNMEGAYTDTPYPASGMSAMISGAGANLDVFSKVGFDVLSLANNHILDVGSDAMLENRSRLRKQGIQTCGAGENISDARTPALVRAEGLTVAYLGYSSIFPWGYEAYANIPGLVPIRAYDVWRTPISRLHMPGAQPISATVPDESDMMNLARDIRGAKELADLVVVSVHAGDQSRPHHLSDHELRTARYCIDVGADMVVGHHHHTLRGMEWYKGCPILYGLGHFVFDFKLGMSAEELERFLTEMSSGDIWKAPYAVAPREGWPYLPMHPDTRMTTMALVSATKDGVHEVGIVPCRLRPDGSVYVIEPGSDDWHQIIAYLEQCNISQKLNGTLELAPSGEFLGFWSLKLLKPEAHV
ncbi:MAG: CapA family protein [Alphaproteobacteria bacterium]|nr:CapA family protein [Alphaproteobacteria bacterium]MDE2493069.1 CapA family protein [Alphaproteobacteria bacterium]